MYVCKISKVASKKACSNETEDAWHCWPGMWMLSRGHVQFIHAASKKKKKEEHNALWKLDPVRKIFKFKQIYALTLILSPHKDEFVCVTLYMLFYKWANILKKSGWKCGMFDEIQTLQLCGKWINLWPLIRSISPL